MGYANVRIVLRKEVRNIAYRVPDSDMYMESVSLVGESMLLFFNKTVLNQGVIYLVDGGGVCKGEEFNFEYLISDVIGVVKGFEDIPNRDDIFAVVVSIEDIVLVGCLGNYSHNITQEIIDQMLLSGNYVVELCGECGSGGIGLKHIVLKMGRVP